VGDGFAFGKRNEGMGGGAFGESKRILIGDGKIFEYVKYKSSSVDGKIFDIWKSI
jgi:hypothetical protein